jgi:hypothetical protein
MDRALEELVWERAGHRCEYCQLAQVYDRLPFEIDHIIAQKHGGATRASNLCGACFACNHHKGPCIASRDEVTKSSSPCSTRDAKSGTDISAGTARSWSASPQSAGLLSLSCRSTSPTASPSDKGSSTREFFCLKYDRDV